MDLITSRVSTMLPELNMSSELGLYNNPQPALSASLLGIQQDIQDQVIQTAINTNTSSSKANTLLKMTRNLNMV